MASDDNTGSNSERDMNHHKRLQELEAKAVAEATASADAAYTPSASLMNAVSAEPLLQQVDGPSLADYYDPNSPAGKESIYVGRSVPIAAGGSLTIPIQVSSPGSVVEYSVENKQYDFGFGITAEREEGLTIVKVRKVWGLFLVFVRTMVALSFSCGFSNCLFLHPLYIFRKLLPYYRKTHASMPARNPLRASSWLAVSPVSFNFSLTMTFLGCEKKSLVTR